MNPGKQAHPRSYKLRFRTHREGETRLAELNLEFEGKRAFAIWDAINIGNYYFKARLELNPKLLKKVKGDGRQYWYSGKLDLPRPENN